MIEVLLLLYAFDTGNVPTWCYAVAWISVALKFILGIVSIAVNCDVKHIKNK